MSPGFLVVRNTGNRLFLAYSTYAMNNGASVIAARYYRFEFIDCSAFGLAAAAALACLYAFRSHCRRFSFLICNIVIIVLREYNN